MPSNYYGYLAEAGNQTENSSVIFGYGTALQPAILNNKFAYDSVLYTLDFSNVLVSGDSISNIDNISISPSGYLTVSSGIIVSGALGVSGAVQTRIASGQPGVLYTLTYEITTTEGDQFSRQALLQVQAPDGSALVNPGLPNTNAELAALLISLMSELPTTSPGSGAILWNDNGMLTYS